MTRPGTARGNSRNGTISKRIQTGIGPVPVEVPATRRTEGAANVIFRREIAAAANPEADRAQRTAEYRDRLMHPYYAAERGLVDDVIDPRETRRVLIRSLATMRDKHASLPSRKHGNPPA